MGRIVSGSLDRITVQMARVRTEEPATTSRTVMFVHAWKASLGPDVENVRWMNIFFSNRQIHEALGTLLRGRLLFATNHSA